jgi:phytoene synthase
VTTTALVLARDDRLACRAWIREHSKSFFLSSLLLPREVRSASWALYAFCRRADDAVDDGAAASVALARVDGLRRRLDSVYRGEAQAHPIDRAFAAVVERYAIPRPLPAALIDGMEMDARGVAYATHDELLVYCFRVAATVGLMMTRIMGCAADHAYLRAADLGVAMQLTNIARDVGEDARRGRVYLPSELCEAHGLAAAAILTMSSASDASRAATRALLARADAHYRSADRGVALLPRGCRVAIASSRSIYSAIGDAIRANGYDSITMRAHVPLAGKLWRVLGATRALLSIARPDEPGPADAQLRPLVVATGLLA